MKRELDQPAAISRKRAVGGERRLEDRKRPTGCSRVEHLLERLKARVEQGEASAVAEGKCPSNGTSFRVSAVGTHRIASWGRVG